MTQPGSSHTVLGSYMQGLHAPSNRRASHHEYGYTERHVAPSATSYTPHRRGMACEHTDDSNAKHNEYLHGDHSMGIALSEATTYNATCGNDSADLLKHCLPEVFVDHAEVRNTIQQENALVADIRYNMGNQRYCRFNDYAYVAKQENAFCATAVQQRQGQQRQNTNTSRRPYLMGSGNAMKQQPWVTANADVFDVWPEIVSAYPVMVRRPENYATLYM